jgi:hypothetical protein
MVCKISMSVAAIVAGPSFATNTDSIWSKQSTTGMRY